MLYSISSTLPKDKKKISGVNYIKCNICNNKIFTILKKINAQYIVNLSGYIDHSNKKKTMKTHYSALKKILNFYKNKKIKKFIQMGSSVEYGFKKAPQKENVKINLLHLKSSYGKAKFKLTNLINNMIINNQFPAVIFRLYLSYGPYQKTNRLIPALINCCLENKTFECSDGKQLRDFLYIDDVVSAIYLAIKNKKALGIYNLGSGKYIKVKNIILKIKKIIKKGNPKFGILKMRNDEPIKLFPCIKKIRKDLLWKPKVSLHQGIIKTIKHYRECRH